MFLVNVLVLVFPDFCNLFAPVEMLQRPWFALAGDPAELGCHTGSDPLKSQGTRCQREPVGTGPWSLQFVTNITGHELPVLGTARPPIVVTLREKHIRGEERVSGSKQTARARGSGPSPSNKV